MGFGGISIWSLLLILAIVILLFGTKKLREEVAKDDAEPESQIIEGKVSEEKDKV
jgi:sec-independent protein translocase protein TatA